MAKLKCGRKPKRSGVTLSSLVGDAIKSRREAMGLSRRKLAARTQGNVSASALDTYERRGREPGLEKYLWICAALNVGPLELLPAAAREVVAARRYGSAEELRIALMG